MEQKDKDPKPSNLPIFMCLGISLGMALGVAFGNIALGMCSGLCIGLGLGSYLDTANRKKDNSSTDESAKDHDETEEE